MAPFALWELHLQTAVDKNDLAAVKAILSRDSVKKEGNLGRKEWTGPYESPLHEAAFLGRDAMVRAMVEEAGLDVNSFRVGLLASRHRLTALHNAVWNKHASTVRLLLDLGADPELKGQWWHRFTELGTPLEWARMKKGHEDVARVLEEHAAKLVPPPARPARPVSSTSFGAMDSVAKMLQKAEVMKKLEEAERVQLQIEQKKGEVRKMEAEIRAGKERTRMRMKALEGEIRKEEEKTRNDETFLKILRENVKGLEQQQQPNFYIDELRRQLEEIETIRKSVRMALKEEGEEGSSSSCLVCSGHAHGPGGQANEKKEWV